MVNRRTVIAGLGALPVMSLAAGAMAPVQAQSEAQMLEGDAIQTSEGELVIHPIQHASMILGWGGHVIYVDPVGGAEAYEGLPAPTGILITHEHGDHYDVPTLEAIAGEAPLIVNPAVYDMLPEGLKANATALANGESGTLSGIEINAIPAYNTTPDRQQYHPEGRDNGYILTLADKRIYIAGDTEVTDAMRALENIAVAFIPMNLPYTMAPEQAAEGIDAFEPEIVYPYHYRGSDVEALPGMLEGPSEVRFGGWYPEGEETEE
ncbi:metal-dependent hydrolase [Devosia pacifica]|uniref:Metal-dependent hydrolase n=1 Tax=Devosia pacifica TaxID=1335967 RepID=A0A918VUP3_9HYPH|nr:MBL fold metallo-hydrolase [Devosia pacifica]GHA24887.1 metal-dependent hydrolase [Devosia pacifica]